MQIQSQGGWLLLGAFLGAGGMCVFEGFQRKTACVQNSWFLSKIEKDLGYCGEYACVRGIYGVELTPFPVLLVLYSRIFFNRIETSIVFLINIR